jgi:hypothetical protein
MRGALRRAQRPPLHPPVVPDIKAGETGTPLAQKLGIRAGTVVTLSGAPPGFEEKLAPLPERARLTRRTLRAAGITILFARNRADLDRRLHAAAGAITPGTSLWIAWPKQTSRLRSDLTQPLVRALGLAIGLVDYKICAIDDTWSALRFTRRRAHGKRAR